MGHSTICTQAVDTIEGSIVIMTSVIILDAFSSFRMYIRQ